MPPPFQAIPNHPSARYRTYRDGYGRFWIECACSACGPSGFWKKQCLRPEAWSQSVHAYGRIHVHAPAQPGARR